VLEISASPGNDPLAKGRRARSAPVSSKALRLRLNPTIRALLLQSSKFFRFYG
jgi:hypothetical protein